MKTAILPGARLIAGLAHVAVRSAIAIIALTITAGNVFGGATVNWISGGPNTGYPSGAGYVDGDITVDAEYHTPCGLAIDDTGDFLFVADRDNNAVRVLQFDINTTGTLLTYSNNIIKTNLFSKPVGVAVDPDYNVFVLNRAKNTNGWVTEFDYTGELIATNLNHLTNASGIALDPADNIYVTASNRVFRVSSTGTRSLLTTITAAGCSLEGIVVKHNGLLAVCDTGRNGILLIDPNTGIVTTNAGFHGKGDFITVGNFSYSNTATFFQPSGITESGDGTLIVSDFGNNRVKAVLANGNVTNVYGVVSNDWESPWPGFMDGTVSLPDKVGGVAGRCENGVVIAPDGSLYVTEDYYHIIRHVTGANFVPEPPQPPLAPAPLTATVITNGVTVEVSLAWNLVNNATNYVVERSTSTNAFAVLASVGVTNAFVDASVIPGATYYYVVIAQNGGGQSPPSNIAGVTLAVPPPVAPTIGYYTYVGTIADGFYTFFTPFAPGTNNIFNNDIQMAILPNQVGVQTFYIDGTPPLSGSPLNGATAPSFANGLSSVSPLPITTVPNLSIEAINENGLGEVSPIATANVQFQCGSPQVVGTNAAQFMVSDVTTNIIYFYTTDGSSPLTNAAAQQVIGTNGVPLIFSINISSTFTFEIVAERGGYAPSAVYTNIFYAQSFQGNELTWGFQSGYCSSEFVASPGQIFYAPVTLTSLPGTALYAFEFNMVVTNLGPDQVPSGEFGFSSMLRQPGTIPNTDIAVMEQIPPLMFIGDDSSPPPASQIVTYNGTNFVNEAIYDTNFNELAVGWFEVYGKTNLFNTLSQNLLSFSEAYMEVIPGGQYPGMDIVGGYYFQVPTNAQPGEQYLIQLNRASGNGDGFGSQNSAVPINLPLNGSMSNGPVNAIKIVTVGQPKYMAGDVYPFHWFNAGDFGYGDLTNYAANDVIATFDAAIYSLNQPPAGSDLFDAMDSAGGIGAPFGTTGYWTKTGTVSGAALNPLFNVNDTTLVNQMAFGDGQLDICDVYVTFIRSQFPNTIWFQRFYTNDTVNGYFGRVAVPIYPQTNVLGNLVSSRSASRIATPGASTPVSITNTPSVHFAAGDYLATAGKTVSIPVTATVYGTNLLRMLMFNVNVVPLDGSPAVTTPVTFIPSAPFNNLSIYNPPIQTNTIGNVAQAYMPNTYPIPSTIGILGSNIIGYVSVAIPANATSSSAYGLSFAHASASPNGLISFPKTTYTGLITLSPRTTSYYNDGIPDSWRLRYFGTIYNDLSVSNADADGTGMDNWQKYEAGLNPVDPTSVLNEGTDQPIAQNPQDLVLYWPSVSGQTYIIERSPTLFPPHWTAISTNMGDGTYMEIHDTSGGGSRFYQVTTP